VRLYPASLASRQSRASQSPPTAAKKRSSRTGGGDARSQRKKPSEFAEAHAAAAVGAEPLRRSQRAAAADAAKNISGFLSGAVTSLTFDRTSSDFYVFVTLTMLHRLTPTYAAEAHEVTFLADPLLAHASSHK
jgi:hypothetical protein